MRMLYQIYEIHEHRNWYQANQLRRWIHLSKIQRTNQIDHHLLYQLSSLRIRYQLHRLACPPVHQRVLKLDFESVSESELVLDVS